MASHHERIRNTQLLDAVLALQYGTAFLSSLTHTAMLGFAKDKGDSCIEIAIRSSTPEPHTRGMWSYEVKGLSLTYLVMEALHLHTEYRPGPPPPRLRQCYGAHILLLSPRVQSFPRSSLLLLSNYQAPTHPHIPV